MPYVNCVSCGIRSFALAPWSAVHRCPTCEAPLIVSRQGAPDGPPQRADWPQPTALDTQLGSSPEGQATRTADAHAISGQPDPRGPSGAPS
jgi:hypothetical protein